MARFNFSKLKKRLGKGADAAKRAATKAHVGAIRTAGAARAVGASTQGALDSFSSAESQLASTATKHDLIVAERDAANAAVNAVKSAASMADKAELRSGGALGKAQGVRDTARTDVARAHADVALAQARQTHTQAQRMSADTQALLRRAETRAANAEGRFDDSETRMALLKARVAVRKQAAVKTPAAAKPTAKAKRKPAARKRAAPRRTGSTVTVHVHSDGPRPAPRKRLIGTPKRKARPAKGKRLIR